MIKLLIKEALPVEAKECKYDWKSYPIVAEILIPEWLAYELVVSSDNYWIEQGESMHMAWSVEYPGQALQHFKTRYLRNAVKKYGINLP